MLRTKLIILFTILSLVSDVKPKLAFSNTVTDITDMMSSLKPPGILPLNNNGQPPTSACLQRQNNCVSVKLCNLTNQVASLLLPSPIIFNVLTQAPCAEINGTGTLSLDLTNNKLSIETIPIQYLKVTQPDQNGFCPCNVCNEACGDLFRDTCENSPKTYQSRTPSMSAPTTLSGSGGLCFATSLNYSQKNGCITLILCNVQFTVFGNRINLADLLLFCAQGQFNVQSTDGVPSIRFQNVRFTSPDKDGKCPCTACAAPCAKNPGTGCPKKAEH